MAERKFGIIAATENELAPFLANMMVQHTEQKAMLRFHVGLYNRLSVVALYCGVCKVNAAIATQLLISEFDVSHILMVGVAGAIDASLMIADTVVANEIAYHDVAPHILVKYHPYMEDMHFRTDEQMTQAILQANATDKTIRLGKMVTGEAFIDQEGRDEIISTHNPLCVDMETASVAHVCYANSVPFAAIRSMSDTPHESGQDAFERHQEYASKKVVQVLERYLNSL